MRRQIRTVRKNPNRLTVNFIIAIKQKDIVSFCLQDCSPLPESRVIPSGYGKYSDL